MFGTVIGILDAFKGCDGEKWFCLAMILEGLCEALVTTVLGLLVAIPAIWSTTTSAAQWNSSTSK
jgi:biopolymer transport protein ExbB/TolQ